MSEPASIRRVYRIVAMLALAGAAAACGYKGPLYMPPAEGGDSAAEQPPPLPDDGALEDDGSFID